MLDRPPNHYQALKNQPPRDGATDNVPAPEDDPTPEGPAPKLEPGELSRSIHDQADAFNRLQREDIEQVVRLNEEAQRTRTEEDSKRNQQAGRPASRPDAWAEDYGLDGKELSEGARAKLDRLQDGAPRETGNDHAHTYDRPTRPGRVRGDD